MKKIISALAIGAMVTCAAFAEVAVTLNYRTGAEIFRYEDAGTTEELNQGISKSWLNLTKHNAGKDNLGIKLVGDIFTVNAVLQPTQDNDKLILHTLTTQAVYGNFTATAGWNGDGVSIGLYRVKNDGDAGNEEGKYFESYKLGSGFTGSYSLFADNMVALSNTDRTLFGLASYRYDLTPELFVTVQGSVLANGSWNASTDAKLTTTNNGIMGYGLLLRPGYSGLFDAQFFVKGSNKLSKTVTRNDWTAGKTYKQTIKYNAYTFGAYVQPLFVRGITIIAGGAASYVDETFVDWSADLRLRYYKNKNFIIGSMNKISGINAKTNGTKFFDGNENEDKDEGVSVAGVAGLGTMTSTMTLWDMAYARYKFNDTVTGILSVGQQTELADRTEGTKDGTQIFVHPHAQIYASGNASVTAGVVFGMGGIGADKGKNTDHMVIPVPVLFRVKM